MDYAALQVDHRDHVAWVTLNRPEALNAMNRALVRELRAFFSGLGEDKDTRLVILRGAGLQHLWIDGLVLLGMGVTLLLIAARRFQRKIIAA